MNNINTQNITNWKIATKTKNVKAKHLSSLLVDNSITSKFLVATLEGNEPLGNNVVICIGVANDAWQQTPKKLLDKYTVTEIDENGWLNCVPKPDNEVDVVQVDESMSISNSAPNDFYIIGLWGCQLGSYHNVQMGQVGDYICRNKSDHSDVWVVKRKIFENTYSIKTL